MGPRLVHYSDVENAYDDPERVGRLAGLLRELKTEGAVLAGTGDNTGPGVLSLVTEGRQALDLFRAVDPDVATFGNHDFDHGPAVARELVRESPQTWVTTNVRDGDGRFGADAGTVPWTVVERGGERVGFLGVTDPQTPSMNPRASDLTVTDPVTAAADAVAALRAEGVDHVVVLSHLGSGDDELAATLDVDVVLGGHVHSERVERVAGTVLTRPGVNGEVVVTVDLDDGRVRRHEAADAPLDESVAASLRERMARAGLDEVVATVEDPIARDEAAAFRGESRIGNFVADAYRWTTGADVGLQNAGGIRAGPPLAGEVTVADLVSVVPFDEPVAVLELTGAELAATLREGHGANLNFGEPDWWHAHVGGAELVYDRGTDELVSVTVDGDPVNPEGTYTLATTDFLTYTDHEFPTLSERHRVRTLGPQHEALAEYARATGIDPEIEGRIRRR